MGKPFEAAHRWPPLGLSHAKRFHDGNGHCDILQIMGPLKRRPFGLTSYRLRIGEMHIFRPTPRKHLRVNAFGISVAFAKHRQLLARLHFKQSRFRRHIAVVTIIAVKMIW